MLKINMEYRKGILFVRLMGRLNKDTSYKLEDFLIKTITKHGIKYLVYNLDNLYSIDQKGIKTLQKGIKAVEKNNGSVMVCSTSPTLDIKDLNVAYINSELSALNLLNA